MNITIGCDPELFIFDNELQRIVPAVGLVKGTKAEPFKLDKGTVQLDGTVVEIGTDPASSAEQWIDNVQSVVLQVKDMLNRKARVADRYELRCGAMAGYVDPVDPKALEVGCDPQYVLTDEHTLEVIPSQGNLSPNSIPVGGHIHIGFGCNLPIHDRRLIVSASRFSKRLPALTHNYLNLYTRSRREALNLGKPAVRIKPYGLELRNPCSTWLADRNYMADMFDYIQTTAKFMHEGRLVHKTRRMQLREEGLLSASQSVPLKYQGTLPLDF